MKNTENDSHIEVTVFVSDSCDLVHGLDKNSFLRIPKLFNRSANVTRLATIKSGRSTITKLIGKRSSLDHGTSLNHQREKMNSRSFFPKIETGLLPVVGHIFKIG